MVTVMKRKGKTLWSLVTSTSKTLSSRTMLGCCLPNVNVYELNDHNILFHQLSHFDQIIQQVGIKEFRRRESEIPKRNFTELLKTIKKLPAQKRISGSLPA